MKGVIKSYNSTGTNQENITTWMKSVDKDIKHQLKHTNKIWALAQQNLSSGVSNKASFKPVSSATEPDLEN